jgi:hypothetical protein
MENGKHILVCLKRFNNNLEKLVTDMDLPDVVMINENNF